MNWFLIALINPVAHALVNHTDKYLISRYLKGGSVGTLILFSSLFAVIALPIIYIIHPTVFNTITIRNALILMVNGALLVTAIICYLYALDYDEASVVAPLFQLVPVFSFLLAYLILGEVLLKSQILGGLMIVGGSTILSLKFSEGRLKIKKQLLLLMLGSSFLYASSAVIFKFIALDQGFYDSLFWDMTGKVIFGVALFFLVKSYRQQFLGLLRSNRFGIIGLNSLNEVIALVGEVSIVLAVLLAPVALVESVASLQPVFVFLFGVIITVFLPKLGVESLRPKDLAQKIIAIVVITAGVYLLPK